MKKNLTLLIALVALGFAVAAFVASQRDAKTTQADTTLRKLLAAQSIAIDYIFPKGANYYYLTSLEFEDGKLTPNRAFVCCTQIHTPSINAEVMWVPGTTKMTTHMPTIRGGKESKGFTMTGFNDATLDFWMKLDGMISNIQDSYEDYTILGYAGSQETREGLTGYAPAHDFSTALKCRKYVGAVAIKTFKTEKEFDDFLKLNNIPNPNDS